MRLIGASRLESKPEIAAPEATDWRRVLRDAAAEARHDASPRVHRVTPAAETRPDSSPPLERVTPPAEAPPKASPPVQRDVPPADTAPARPPSRRLSFAPDSAPAEPAAAVESHATMPLERIPVGYAVGTAGSELFGGPVREFDSLDDLVSAVSACQKCGLYATAKHPVPGEGSEQAQLVCVGEAPGATEDELGRPFVGPAGQLLDKILAAIKLSRNDVYICNVLKHRPPGNRNPMPDEVEACSPYLVRQIELIRTEGDRCLRHLRRADVAEHEGLHQQVAWEDSPILRRAPGRHLPSGRAAPQSRVEAPDVGRCPACSTTPRSRRQSLMRSATADPSGPKTRSRRCSARCSWIATRSCARPNTWMTRCSTARRIVGCSAPSSP